MSCHFSFFKSGNTFERHFSFYLFKQQAQLSSSQSLLQIKWHQKQTSFFCWFSQSTPPIMATVLTTTRLSHHRRRPLTVRLWCWTWLTVSRLCKPEAQWQSHKDLAVPHSRQCWRLTLSVYARLLGAVLLLVSLWMSQKPKRSLRFAKSLRLLLPTVLVSIWFDEFICLAICWTLNSFFWVLSHSFETNY